MCGGQSKGVFGYSFDIAVRFLCLGLVCTPVCLSGRFVCFFLTAAASRLSDFQVMSFLLLLSVAWSLAWQMDCCQVKVIFLLMGLSISISLSLSLLRPVYITRVIEQITRTATAHKSSYEIPFVSIICLIFIG